MGKFFNNINSLEDLKKQYKKLSRVHHPDMGGNLEDMQKLNAEFDNLFKIYQNGTETSSTETAESFRSEFYTQNGWKGDKYDEVRYMSTVDIAKLIRKDLKNELPECKFSVTTETASMCSEIYVSLMSSPYPAYMTEEEIIESRKDETIWNDYRHPLNKHYDITVNGKYYNCNFMINFTEQRGLTDEELEVFCNTVKIPTEKITVILKTVDKIVKKYRYSDCDGMIDYFDTNFYYFDCKIGKWNKEYICNPELAKKIKQKKVETTATTNVKVTETTEEKTILDTIQIEVISDTDTRDNSEITVVKLIDKLDREEYKKVAEYIKSIGGYYSRFKKGFIFKTFPIQLKKYMENKSELIEKNPSQNKIINKLKYVEIIKKLAYQIYLKPVRTKYYCKI